MKNRSKKVSRVVIGILAGFLVMVCPATIYASSVEAIAVNKQLVAYHQESNTFEEKSSQEHIKRNTLNESEMQVVAAYDKRGVNSIDQTLDKGKALTMKITMPGDADKIAVSFSTDDTNDAFRIGLIDSSGKERYVATTSGALSHTFSVTPGQTYTLAIYNKSSYSIHLVGRIII